MRLTADRPYRQGALPFEGVEAVLTTGGGTHFDEDCVAACMDGVVELAVASRQARRDVAGRVGAASDATRATMRAGTSRPMLFDAHTLSSPIRPASPTSRTTSTSIGATQPASLQEMLRARLPRVIVTPAILAAIVAIFVAMVARVRRRSPSRP